MALSAAHFSAVADLVHAQTLSLPALPVQAGPEEGFEESAREVDVDETAARVRRHAAEAARASPSAEALYEEYVATCVDAMGLPDISGAEVVAVHKRVARNGAKNALPPAWGLARLLLCLVHDQAVRSTAGAPLRFNSLYRATAYNRAIGGASKSAHRVCTARDRVLLGQSAAQLHQVDRALRPTRHRLTTAQRAVVARVVRDYRLGPVLADAVYGEPFSARGVRFDGAAFTHEGGLGRYASFVHADCRGERSDWRG